jgi:hypothetical protein
LDEALPALVEMARWKNPDHAFAALLILGRMAGQSDEVTVRAANSGQGESIILGARVGT